MNAHQLKVVGTKAGDGNDVLLVENDTVVIFVWWREDTWPKQIQSLFWRKQHTIQIQAGCGDVFSFSSGFSESSDDWDGNDLLTQKLDTAVSSNSIYTSACNSINYLADWGSDLDADENFENHSLKNIDVSITEFDSIVESLSNTMWNHVLLARNNLENFTEKKIKSNAAIH